ncbi:outer membrane beta-barrel protein [Nibribacter koreensis]|uniref:Outer membrane protein beta-barrel domain-containing protein n=1 Tax=Nibribacter koreensis TaxID=1084519 RepID=A0ABP8FY21_9BACT
MKESSGEDNKRNRRVEDVFRDGFEGAQVPPPARLWDNLDQALENQELKHYRTQAFWYRSVAAACLLLLLTAGAYLWQQDQSLFGTNEGHLAKAPAAKSTPSEGASGVNQNAINKSGEEESTKESSVFGSNPGKQAKNEMASHQSVERTTNSLPSRQEDKKQSRPLSAETGRMANSQEKINTGAVTLGSRGEANPAALAISATNPKADGAGKAAEAAIRNDESSSMASASVMALESFKTNSSLATTKAGTAVSADSLMNTRVATVLYQGEGNNLQMAKVDVEPTPALPEEKKKTTLKGWMVSLSYTPLYAYAPIAVAEAPSREGIRMSAEQQQMYEQYDQALQEYRESYSPAYSYSAKLGAGYQLNDHWQIETGFLYGHNEATTTHSFLITKADNVMRINSAVPRVNRPEPIVKVAFEPELVNNLEAVTPTERYQTKYKYQQIGVPLRIAYHKSISKVFAFVSGGVNLNLLLNNRIESDNQDVQAKRYHYKDEASPFRAWQWAAATSAGIGYQVNRKMSLTVAPELTYSFSSALKESQTQADPYQVGVSIGGKYRLSK